MDLSNLVGTIGIYAIPVVLAITLHEAAHGYVAKLCGDMTAARSGRISLNPARHVDPLGTIVVPLAILLLAIPTAGTAILFGWAKPVPVNYHALRRPRQHMLWVAAAGPGANLVQALVWASLLKLTSFAGLESLWGFPVQAMATAGVVVNLVLMVLNLLPILPLDGGRIAVCLLPARLALSYARLERFGFPILLLVVFAHLQMGLLDPLMSGAERTVVQLFGLKI